MASSLIFGKVAGILLFTAIAFYSGLGSFTKGITWGRLLGISLLGGVGFTMSIFISGLAFSDAEILNNAKIGILMGSLIAGISGFFLLKHLLKSNADEKQTDAPDCK
jgi:NhaA family Na+:H+ antiporter